jgi:hypothetical protein
LQAHFIDRADRLMTPYPPAFHRRPERLNQ